MCSDGKAGWMLRNASTVRLPGTKYTYEDATIIGTDIRAGNAVVHITDLP